MTDFDNSAHKIQYLTGDTLDKRELLPASDLILEALEQTGIWALTVSATAPLSPADKAKWLDKSTTPATPKVYDAVSTTWLAATFDTWFGGGEEDTTITFTASTSAPTGVLYGDIWLDLTDLTFYVWVNDGTTDWWIDYSTPVISDDSVSKSGGDTIYGSLEVGYLIAGVYTTSSPPTPVQGGLAYFSDHGANGGYMQCNNALTWVSL